MLYEIYNDHDNRCTQNNTIEAIFTILGCLSPDIIVIYNADQSANILKAIRRNDNQKTDYEVSETLRPLYI